MCVCVYLVKIKAGIVKVLPSFLGCICFVFCNFVSDIHIPKLLVCDVELEKMPF